jgi:hypothetical protein
MFEITSDSVNKLLVGDTSISYVEAGRAKG